MGSGVLYVSCNGRERPRGTDCLAVGHNLYTPPRTPHTNPAEFGGRQGRALSLPLSPLGFERVCSTLCMCACDDLFQAICFLGIWKFEIWSTPPAPLNFDSRRDRPS